ncbi:MAG: hypothetical protein DHS20C10_09760 [marine bacterium B5-7]|nr:MAG: hypothetical protein DHS20C10_09760 [marine bacterium B5-7]
MNDLDYVSFKEKHPLLYNDGIDIQCSLDSLKCLAWDFRDQLPPDAMKTNAAGDESIEEMLQNCLSVAMNDAQIDQCMSLLLLALKMGCAQVVSFLVSQPQVSHAIQANNSPYFLVKGKAYTPLWMAVYAKQAELVSALLSVDDDALRTFMIETLCSDRTPLMEAARQGLEEITKKLLPFMTHAQLRQLGAHGENALHWAISSKEEVVVRVLFDDSRVRDAMIETKGGKGFDEQARDLTRDISVLDCLKLLVSAVENDQPISVRILLKRKRVSGPLLQQACTPLVWAILLKKFAVIEVLLRLDDLKLRTFMLEAVDDDRTPLMLAASLGFSRIVAMLLPFMTEAQLAQRGPENGNALHWAVYSENETTVCTLLNDLRALTAMINVRDKKRHMLPHEYALFKKQDVIAQHIYVVWSSVNRIIGQSASGVWLLLNAKGVYPLPEKMVLRGHILASDSGDGQKYWIGYRSGSTEMNVVFSEPDVTAIASQYFDADKSLFGELAVSIKPVISADWRIDHGHEILVRATLHTQDGKSLMVQAQLRQGKMLPEQAKLEQALSRAAAKMLCTYGMFRPSMDVSPAPTWEEGCQAASSDWLPSWSWLR